MVVVEQTMDVGRLPEIVDGVEDGLRVIRVRHRPTRGLPAAVAYIPAALAAVRRLRRGGFRFDVVHGHIYAAGLVADLIGVVFGRPVVVTEHFSEVQLGTLSRTARALAAVAYRGATIVAPVSESLRAAMTPLAPRARFRVLPNLVDTSLFSPPPVKAAGARLLYVGRLVDVKNLPMALRALALLRDRDVRLDVVGDGPERPKYERLARELGLQGSVTFHGAVDKPAVATLMREVQTLLVPSRTETFGVVAIEAMASGLPVVATRVGALPEIVDDTAGALVPADDAEAMARAAAAVLDGQRTYDARALAQRAHDRYGVAAVTARWSAVYAEAVRLRAEASRRR